MDAYARLRPHTSDRTCDCENIERFLLVYTMTSNPIQCFKCKGIVDLERLTLTREQVDLTANWHHVFGALYELWLASGEYETWAKSQLLRKDGEVNVKGMAVRAALAQVRPTFYWWFHETDDSLPSECPWCAGAVVSAERHGQVQCDSCWIVI